MVHGHTSSTVSVWLINFEDISANKLPPGNYHWQGRDLAVAGKNEVTMFNLDSRNGRYKTILAQFDNLQAMTILQDSVYIIGQKQELQGLWKLDLTAKKQNSIRPLSNLGL